MRECPECHKSFPSHLIQPMIGFLPPRDMCPICALRIRNEEHGLPKDTPFQGEIAKEMHEEAKRFLKEKSY